MSIEGLHHKYMLATRVRVSTVWGSVQSSADVGSECEGLTDGNGSGTLFARHRHFFVFAGHGKGAEPVTRSCAGRF